jgi:hypothetical protein
MVTPLSALMQEGPGVCNVIFFFKKPMARHPVVSNIRNHFTGNNIDNIICFFSVRGGLFNATIVIRYFTSFITDDTALKEGSTVCILAKGNKLIKLA